MKNQIHPTAIIYPNVKIGTGNKIGAYAVIGSPGEIRNTEHFNGHVEIGNNNTISEFVSIQRPAVDGQVTRIGSNNIIMAHSHIGHDASIGDNCELSTGTIVGGYAVIRSGAKIKLNVTIRNRKHIGAGALVGMGSVVVSNVAAESTVYGNPAKVRPVPVSVPTVRQWSAVEFWLLVAALVACLLWGFAARGQTPDSVLAYVKAAGIHSPEIVTKQSILETGNYGCKGCSMDNNNIFGFRYKGKYLKFNHWTESVDYYKKWQAKHFEPGRDYYDFLNCLWKHSNGDCARYATEPEYTNRLKNIEL